MSGQFFIGNTADGRDMRPALGMFTNPNNKEEYSNMSYNDEQRKYVKLYNFHWKLMKNANYDFEVAYQKIKNGTLRFFTKIEKEYIVESIESEAHE